jgi:hypothetical protein
VRVPGYEAPRVRLGQARADEDVLDETADPLVLRKPSLDVPPERHRVRDTVEERPRHLLDEVDLARHVPRPPGGHRHVPVLGDLEAEAAEGRALLVGRNLEPDHTRRALRT